MIDRRDLEDVRYYLRCWRAWCHGWRPDLGWPQSCLAQFEGPPAWDSTEDPFAESEEREQEIGDYVLHRIDQCVEALPGRKRACVRHVYLREHINIPVRDARAICLEAEADLVPMLRSRNVLVGTSVL